LNRNLRAGEPIRTSDIRPALLVRRGTEVMLTVTSSGGFQISIRVEAMADARMGEQVQLRNLESGRLLMGVVTGRNAARGL
jgi:flagella basal body P-ring formation protein FlgA